MMITAAGQERHEMSVGRPKNSFSLTIPRTSKSDKIYNVMGNVQLPRYMGLSIIFPLPPASSTSPDLDIYRPLTLHLEQKCSQGHPIHGDLPQVKYYTKR
jgi:hypothetical protein